MKFSHDKWNKILLKPKMIAFCINTCAYNFFPNIFTIYNKIYNFL